jgi:hypothetical protein
MGGTPDEQRLAVEGRRVSLVRWWVSHPWRGWWASYGFLILGVGLYALRLEKTSFVFFGAAMLLWNASIVQGLRVTWHKSRRKAILIALLLFAVALANPIQKAVYSGDYASLDTEILIFLGLFVLYVVAAIITEYLVRFYDRFATADSPSKTIN